MPLCRGVCASHPPTPSAPSTTKPWEEGQVVGVTCRDFDVFSQKPLADTHAQTHHHIHTYKQTHTHIDRRSEVRGVCLCACVSLRCTLLDVHSPRCPVCCSCCCCGTLSHSTVRPPSVHSPSSVHPSPTTVHPPSVQRPSTVHPDSFKAALMKFSLNS